MGSVPDEIQRCEAETGHRQVSGTQFCRCTHVMFDGAGEFLPPSQEQYVGYLEEQIKILQGSIIERERLGWDNGYAAALDRMPGDSYRFRRP